MRRRAVPGQGGNRPTLVGVATAERLRAPRNDHFRVWPWPEINVIARMVIMNGI